jgi:hypothetical protein
MMNIDFTTLTEDELKALYRGIVNEHDRRNREKRAKLIDIFKQAFCALQEAGIDVTYSDADNEVEDLPLC